MLGKQVHSMARLSLPLLLLGATLLLMGGGAAQAAPNHAVPRQPAGRQQPDNTPGMITEFALPSGNAPFKIADGPDGNLWFTELAGNEIGRISLSGSITEFAVPTPNSFPVHIAAGPDGNLWFTEGSSSKIGRITPNGVITEFPVLTANSTPNGITAGPDGNIWFTEIDGNTIGRITPGGTVTEFPVPTASALPAEIISGPDGNLWFTEAQADKIGRITTSGTVTEFTVPTAGQALNNLTVGSNGNIWFVETSTHNAFAEITTGGMFTEFPLMNAQIVPRGITAGPDGNLWFTDVNNTQSLIGVLGTNGAVIHEFPLSTLNASLDITSGPDGNLWFTEYGNHKIGRITSGVQVSPSAVSLVTTPGASPGAQTLSLSNGSPNALHWSIATLPAWVNVSPTSGTLTAGGTQQLTLTFNTPSSTPQSYITTLSLTTAAGATSPLMVPITVVSTTVSKTWYFAEGTTMTGFSEFLTLANPNSGPATVTVTYLLGSGQPVIKMYTVNGNQRATINVGDPMQGVGPGQAVSMVVTSNVPIVAERPMYFNFFGIPGGSDVLGATQLATSFDFGYLDTTTNHSTFLTVLNQNNTALTVTVHYFAQNGTMTTATHLVPANSRGTVTVSSDVAPGIYSALVTLSLPGLVERPMYLIDGTTHFTGSADVVGVATPLTDWYFAEGYYNPSGSPTFDERYIVSNPNSSGMVTGTISFFLSNGTTKMTPFSLGPGQQQILDAGLMLGGNTPNSAHVSASAPILAERFQSFNFGGDQGASDVLGAAAPSNLFYFAEGTTQSGFSEYLTIENPDPMNTALVTVTFLPANGNSPVVKLYLVAPSSRFTLDTSLVLSNQAFSLVVEASVAIVAERPMYFNFFGDTGGTDVVGYQP